MAVSWLLPLLAPTHRQGANADQNTNGARIGKTGRELGGGRGPSLLWPACGCVRQPGQVSKKGVDGGKMVRASQCGIFFSPCSEAT